MFVAAALLDCLLGATIPAQILPFPLGKVIFRKVLFNKVIFRKAIIRKDFFNKKQPESSPLYKISKAESKTESNDPKLIGAGFATRKDLISAANAGMKNLVNVANSPQDDALKF